MAAHLRWKFEDPADANPATRVYTFYRNPNTMSSPFPVRSLTHAGTTAPNGQVLLWEGVMTPTTWQFGGPTWNAAHHEMLRSWVYDRQGRKYVYDHFGRRLTVVFQQFSFEPPEKPRYGRYWWGQYTIEAIVLAMTPPANGLPE